MFWIRLGSGIGLVILSILVLYLGGTVTWAVSLLVSLLGMFELLRVYRLEKKLPGILAYLATVLYYVFLLLGYQSALLPMAILYLLVLLAAYVITFPKYRDQEISAAFLAFFYVSVMLSYIYQIRILENGGYLIILVFVCSWGNDTLAYAAGVSLGKHKMTPKLSPKKSVEGLIGGILGAGILGALFGILYSKYVYALDNAPLIFGLVGAIGAIPAVIGDLAASAIKRNHEIKDYGKLIPGHGGILDRFDSMIFTAPIIYYLVTLFM
jgi:phosphatidate cytidylyltransferase